MARRRGPLGSRQRVETYRLHNRRHFPCRSSAVRLAGLSADRARRHLSHRVHHARRQMSHPWKLRSFRETDTLIPTFESGTNCVMSMRARRCSIGTAVFVGAVAWAVGFPGVARAELLDPSAPADSLAATATQPAVAAATSNQAPVVQPSVPVPAVQAPAAPAPPTAPTAAPVTKVVADGDATVRQVTSAAVATPTRVASAVTRTARATIDNTIVSTDPPVRKIAGTLGSLTTPVKRVADERTQDAPGGRDVQAPASPGATRTGVMTESGAKGVKSMIASSRQSPPAGGPSLRSSEASAPTFALAPLVFVAPEAAEHSADGSRRAPAPLPQAPPGTGLGAAAAGSGGGLLLFGLLAFALLLAIPTAVRWLRAALALGLSPAYVAPSDRPG